MRTSPNTIPGFILLVTVGVLSAAYSAQYIGGLRPCILCLYSRIPWFVAGGLMLVTILMHFSGPARSVEEVVEKKEKIIQNACLLQKQER